MNRHLDQMSRKELIAEVKKLREYRDITGIINFAQPNHG